MEQPPLEELRNRRMREAAAALSAAKGTILQRWREEVIKILPGADELTRKQLDDSLPDLLDRISGALDSDQAGSTDWLIQLSPSHGVVRYHQEFSLNQLMIEYHILRRLTVQEMAKVLGRTLSIEESIAVNQGLDITMRQAAVAFTDHQTRAMQAETAAMTKFLSFLSHDLRGGLNGAVLMIEVLKRQLVGDEKFAGAVEDLDVVRRSILDTVSTMERFLSAEKLRLGRMPVKPSKLVAADLLGEFKKGLAYQLKENDVELVVDCDPGLTISSDRQLITLVLQNLLSNAIKYGRRGKIILAARVPGPDAPSVSCRFSVTDQGPGVAPEKLNEIFAAFARGDTYGQKGVGLGLYIAKHAADLLGAKLWADSKVGAGSTFYLDLN